MRGGFFKFNNEAADMRLITVKAPKGNAQKIAEVAFSSEISHVTITEHKAVYSNKKESILDVVDIEATTPKAKKFVESLMIAGFYDPTQFNYTVRKPESIFATEPPEKESMPFTRPSTDVYIEFWQYSQITTSLVLRVLISSLLMGYGVEIAYLPLIIAGLLFLPYHHSMIGMAVGSCMTEWRLFKQSTSAFLLITALIFIGGLCIASFMEPPIAFTSFQFSPLTSFILSAIIGIAAGYASMDDAGRRELIGLAASAQTAIYPLWFGMKAIYGFNAVDKPLQSFLTFLMSVVTIVAFASIVHKLCRMRSRGIKNFLVLHKAMK